MATVTKFTTFEVISCVSCGIPFGVPSDYMVQVWRDGKTVCCPNGHGNSWGDSDADKLRKELIRAQQALDQQKAATVNARARVFEAEKQVEKSERRVSAQKAIVTKLKKKAATGSCPCCERTFADLAGHMATEHPDFEGREEPEATETPS